MCGGFLRFVVLFLFVMYLVVGMGVMFLWLYLVECSEESWFEDVVVYYISWEVLWLCLLNEIVCIFMNIFGVGCGKLVLISRIVLWNYSSCWGESELKLISVVCSWDGGEIVGNLKCLDCNWYVSFVCNFFFWNFFVSVDVKWIGVYSIFWLIDVIVFFVFL